MTNSQDIIIILDESGSMFTMNDEVLQSINDFIQIQKTNDNSKFSIWKFNTCVNLVINNLEIKSYDLNNLKNDLNYKPCGMTALYDAIGFAIENKNKISNEKDVTCVIITDGLENSSINFSKEHIKNIINEYEKDFNWNFIYLGANQDSFQEGNCIGIDIHRCANFTTDEGNLSQIMRTISEDVKQYRSLSPNQDSKLKLKNMPENEFELNKNPIGHLRSLTNYKIPQEPFIKKQDIPNILFPKKQKSERFT